MLHYFANILQDQFILARPRDTFWDNTCQFYIRSLPWLFCQFPVVQVDKLSVQHVSTVEAPRGRSSRAARRYLAGSCRRQQWFDPSLCRTPFSRESYSFRLHFDRRPLHRRCLHQGLCRPWRTAPHLRTRFLQLINKTIVITSNHNVYLLGLRLMSTSKFLLLQRTLIT